MPRPRRLTPRPISGPLSSLRTQANRQWSVRTPLGPDAMLLEWFRGREEISRLGEFELGLLSESTSINPKSMLGQEVTVSLRTPRGITRHFSGIVSAFVEEPGWDDLAVYRVTLVPWLWLLTRTHDCRIFQDMSVPEILSDTFRRYGMANVDFRLGREAMQPAENDRRERCAAGYPRREYCAQYRESAFNFVSRLMEEEGIAWHAEHHEDRHVVVLTDSSADRTPLKGYERIPLGNEPEGKQGGEHVWGLSSGEEVRPGAYASTDYNFMNPKDNLHARTRHRVGHANDRFEVFDYPGRYHLYASGEWSTRIRLMELQTGRAWVEATGDARGLATGRTFTLFGHEPDDRRALLVTAAEYFGRGDGFDSGEGSTARGLEAEIPGGEVFRCRFTAMPASEEYLPAQITPKPTIQGPQTAVVVGNPNKEIDVDRYGRIKVHFHWDRHNPQEDQNSSCRMRVSQPWAGLSYGGLAIPRIGHEVVVEFLEGDPDKPMVTGRVYNASRRVPISGAGKDVRKKCRAIRPPLAPPPLPPGLPRATPGAAGPNGATASSTYPLAGAMTGGAASAVAATSGGYGPTGSSNGVMNGSALAASTLAEVKGAGTPVPRWDGETAGARLFDGPPAAGPGFSSSLAGPSEPDDADVGPPSTIEEAAQLTTIRSNSLGKTGGCNEITMDDTSGEEGLFLKAQHDEMHTVGHDQFVSVGNNRTTQVGVDSVEKIGNNMSLDVGVNAQESVGVAKVVDVGSTLLLRAGTSITLQCGASMIHMNQAGFITISGSVISIAGTVNTNMTAPITNVTGAMLLTLTGAVNLSLGAVCRTQAATLASINSGAQAEVVAGADAVVQGSNVKLN